MSSLASPDEVFEHHGMLWKRKAGAESSFEQLATARSFLLQTNEDALWNPWLRDDRASELDAAMDVMREWTRAEPDFRQWTAEETQRWLDEGDRARAAARAEEEARWERGRALFDTDLFASRRGLLEQESIHEHILEELEEFRSGRRFPGMASDRRQKEVTELEERLATCDAHLVRLRAVVPDPEVVVSERGQLPSDRRYSNLLTYKFNREFKVRDLRRQLPELRAELKAATDKGERKELREKVSREQSEPDYWLAVRPLSADEMCSECPTPLTGHGWVSHGLHGARPCPAWPGWAARMKQAREMFFEMIERNQRAQTPPAPPKPEPLAVVPSGLPLGEILAQLSELQAQFPDAVVKRGRANRWELWPKD
ncbi:hypothetical protein Q9S36_14775 [Microbacterium sp. ARD31]|uniref:hypothetical protein n=1 Tax=Microbacterium sp. ARD31 TaxID=2962576 RepID=UPI002881D652|nr:hypothetical protein [Microbacterium sp. ARD31]MDT0181444.1 hypothetical protein [Microbacterium sp. ARD31]